MNNPGTILKVVAVAGGAILGALLSHWVDDLIARQARPQSDYDKERYAQGLGPIPPQSSAEENK